MDGYASLQYPNPTQGNPAFLKQHIDAAKWVLVDASQKAILDADVPGFSLKKDLRQNKWFKLFVANPEDIPGVGKTAAGKIDSIGKLIGLFPDQNETEELYKALTKATQQIVNQAFLQDENLYAGI